MNTYTCDNHRAIKSDSIREAAEEFARRKAQAEFGRSARVGAIRMNAHNQSLAEFEAFIGRQGSNQRETVGHNVWFTVHAV